MAGKNSLLPHGFKAKAERTASKYREELSLEAHDPLCGFKLAEHLKVNIYTPSEFLQDLSELEALVGNIHEDNGWSALTMLTEKGNKIIIHNHLHSPNRQQSNIMHELAHIICEHKEQPSDQKISLPSYMRQFNPQQEEEAIYLGATLQVTRAGLLWALKKKMNYNEISNYFNASTEMITFRINDTGVNKQLNFYK